ncbi:MAG TPA: hypothetical protein PKA00_07425 [Saprospiraceae bacterium]|nr:hypothetical protein [Saprospiraceae bacterium]HMQ82721.1 hypothetical protein [Saprospiraceae bacterium]
MNTNPIFDEKLKAILELAPLEENHLEWDAEAVWAKIDLPKKKPRAWWVLAVVGVALLGGVGWWWMVQTPPNAVPTLTPRLLEPILETCPDEVPLSPPRAEINTPLPKLDKAVRQVEPQEPLEIEVISPPEKLDAVAPIASLDLLDRQLLSQQSIRPLPDKAGVTIVMRLPDLDEKPTATYFVRLLREIGRFNTEGKINWYNLNIEPQEGMSFRIITYKNADQTAKDN